MELRRLEEEASLAELEWKIETEYNDEGGLTVLLVPWMLPHSSLVTSKEIEASGSDANPGAISAIGKGTVS